MRFGKGKDTVGRQAAAVSASRLPWRACVCQQEASSFSHSGIQETTPSLHLFAKLSSLLYQSNCPVLLTLLITSYWIVSFGERLLGASWGGNLTHSCIFSLHICAVQPFSATYTRATLMFYVNCINRGLPRMQWELEKDAFHPAWKAQDKWQGQLVFCLSPSTGNGPLSC